MTAEGYKSEPLSVEMESRIRARIARYRETSQIEHRAGRAVLGAISDGAVAALEWILHEAEALKNEMPARALSLALMQNPAECPECRHVHSSGGYCGEYLGEMEFCQCEAKVTA